MKLKKRYNTLLFYLLLVKVIQRHTSTEEMTFYNWYVISDLLRVCHKREIKFHAMKNSSCKIRS